jgi:hypothetical protein
MWNLGKWGSLIWGASQPVPWAGPVALVGMALLLLVMGRVLIRSDRAAHRVAFAGVFLLAMVPVVAFAVPHTFVNGTVANATQVNANFTAVEARLNALEALTASMRLENGVGTASELVFSGVNVHIQSGLGETDGVPNGALDTTNPVTNGRGNLVIGYNEAFGDTEQRTGSHNVVIGVRHSYPSFGTLLAGEDNSTSAPLSSVTGGLGNAASRYLATVSGGRFNTASGLHSSVTGGHGNTASGEAATVSGGGRNTANALYSSVSGGLRNLANGNNAAVSGGLGNTASGVSSSVAGGEGNTAAAPGSHLP